MLRKITLTGFALLISEANEHARVLLALCVSITFLVLQLILKPFVSEVDDALAGMVQLVLVLLYLAILLLKTCEVSEETCVAFGFGGTGEGIFYFFVFFSLSLLLLIIILSLANLWLTGHVGLLFELLFTNRVVAPH